MSWSNSRGATIFVLVESRRTRVQVVLHAARFTPACLEVFVYAKRASVQNGTRWAASLNLGHSMIIAGVAPWQHMNIFAM